MKKHLIKIADILHQFKLKYQFIEAYLNIRGNISVNSHSSLIIDYNSEFDNYAVAETKQIKIKIYEEIRKYLEKENIDKTLYIETEYRGWAASNQLIYFKEDLKC